MPQKADRFYIFTSLQNGAHKGERLLGVKHSYEGDANNLTLEDLIDFIEKNNIKTSDVVLPCSFITFAKC